MARDGWRTRALCRDGDLSVWFPPESLGEARVEEASARAAEVCARCPVLLDCREYALEAREPAGVWGGMSTKQRVALLRREARARWNREGAA